MIYHFLFFDEDASFAGQKSSFISNPDNNTVNTDLDTAGDSTYVSTVGTSTAGTETTYTEASFDDAVLEGHVSLMTCGALDKLSLDSYIEETQKILKGTAAKSREVGSAFRKFFDKKMENLTESLNNSLDASFADTNRTDDLATLNTKDSENTLQTRNNSVAVSSVN